MEFKVTLYQSKTDIFDITKVVTPVSFADIINSAGIITFGFLPNPIVKPVEGNEVEITCDGITVYGTIFKLGYSARSEIKVTVYDQLRYLKTNETYVFRNNETASQIVTKLCGDFRLILGTIEDTRHPLGTMTFDNKPVLDMIADCVTKTLVDKRQLYYLKDEAGKVVFRNIQNSVSDLVISPDSLLLDYNYERSIDDDTFNQIKLVRDNKETGQREVFMTKDSKNIEAWGRGRPLQYYEKLDDKVNAEQAKEKADSLLFLKNRVGQKLSAELIGEKGVRAGNMLFVGIDEIGISRFLLCTSVNHGFSNKYHTAKADFKLV